MVFALLRIAVVFMLGVGAVAEECELRDIGDAHYTTSLLQVSMKMHHQPRALHHNMKAAPSGTRILDAYNTCHPHAFPVLDQGYVIIHPASETHFIHIFKNAGSTIASSVEVIGGSRVAPSWLPEHRDDIRQLLSNDTWFTTSLVRDPLKRSLSAFHEVWKRDHCVPPRGYCLGLDCDSCTEGRPVDSKLIDSFREKLLTPQSSLMSGSNFSGTHFLPQVSFLLHHDGSKVALDYIGSLDDDLENEFHFIFDTQVPLVDALSGGLQQTDLFRIEPAQLPEDVLVQVCNAYHADYCCFGYDFPDACKKAGFACEGSR